MNRACLFAIVVLLAALLPLAPSFSQDTAAAPKAPKAAATLTVAEAKLGTDVQNKEIVGEGTQFELNQKVYLWLKLTGGPAEDVTVTWKQGDKSYETKLKVGGSPWRTWAYKTAAIAGSWTVTVADNAGTELKQLEFTVSPAPAKEQAK